MVFIVRQEECCGVVGYSDYKGTKWQLENEVKLQENQKKIYCSVTFHVILSQTILPVTDYILAKFQFD